MCERGYRVSQALKTNIDKNPTALLANEGLRLMLTNPETKSLYQVNDTIKRPKFARTLRTLADFGADEFYNGSLTPIIVQEINQNGGKVTLEDFYNYRVKVYENQVMMRLDDNFRIYAPPPPSASVLVGYILKIMKGFEVKNRKKMSSDDEILFYHRFIETLKFAYAKRDKLADPDYVDVSKVGF
jgi:gamma-glutamyltranspeptidase/glutathione hydrolase/leukotriene-C4 hydrolase